MKNIFFTLSLLLYLSIGFAQSQSIEPKNVAIFLYQDVELLDFAGPGEVFTASGFNTYTVSVDGKPLTSQGFVSIQPQFSISNAPIPDIIVVPGGNASPSAKDEQVINWIKNAHKKGTQFMSVCTGAFILAKAGLLENKRVTTHWGSLQNLSAQYPKTTVLEDTRWVDNASVITTAGVSAGIDGALHLIARIKGLDAAKKTARYMEYDKWDPSNGIVDAPNEYLENILTHKNHLTDNSKATVSDKGKDMALPYQGEFINLANQLVNTNDYASASKIVEEGIKLYPDSYALYQILGSINRKSGKPAPISQNELVALVRQGKVDEAIYAFERDKKKFVGWKLYSENEMKDAAYYLLLDKKDYVGAIKIFTLNTKEFAHSADTFDSLGEAYLTAGDKRRGIENYKIAAQMGYSNAKKVLQQISAQ